MKIVTLLNCYFELARNKLAYIVKLFKNPITIQRSLPGQALLLLIVFAAMATVITAGAIAVTIINSQTTSKFALGEEALFVAESGAENAILKLLRNPSYSGSIINEIVAVGNGSANVEISGSPTVTVSSTGQVGNFIRKIQVTGNYSNNQFTLTSWQQVD